VGIKWGLGNNPCPRQGRYFIDPYALGLT